MAKASRRGVEAPGGPRLGQGTPRSCECIEGPAGYHDGAGLASPGRWGPEARIFPDWDQLRKDLVEGIVEKLGGWHAAERQRYSNTGS